MLEIYTGTIYLYDRNLFFITKKCSLGISVACMQCGAWYVNNTLYVVFRECNITIISTVYLYFLRIFAMVCACKIRRGRKGEMTYLEF